MDVFKHCGLDGGAVSSKWKDADKAGKVKVEMVSGGSARRFT